jgi:hypothetical protein
MATVAEEKFGSFRVHFRRVPAGRTVSRALALVVRPGTVRLRTAKVRRDTARTANELDFITHLGLTPWNFWYVFPNYRDEPAPIEGVLHKLTHAVNRTIGGRVWFLCNSWRAEQVPALGRALAAEGKTAAGD